jgi:hypothetical protein
MFAPNEGDRTMGLLWDSEKEAIKILMLSGAARGRRIRVLVNTLIHKGPTEPGQVDEVRLFAANIGGQTARLYLHDGRRERVFVISGKPGEADMVPIFGGELSQGEVLTARADLKNIYVWGKVIRRRDPAPTILERAIARLSLWWLDVKGALRR